MSLEKLTKLTFSEKVHNLENQTEWKYLGNVPSIIDFYADWCQPCKIISPVLESLQEEYGDKLIIYKVNVDNEPELSQLFGIKSIPSLLFIPVDQQPQMSVGVLSKDQMINAIENVLGVNI